MAISNSQQAIESASHDGPPIDPNGTLIDLSLSTPGVFAVADERTGGSPDSLPTISPDASPSGAAPVTPDTGSTPSPDSPDGGSPNRPSTSQENSEPNRRTRLGSLALTAGLALGIRKGFDLGIFADAKENLGPATGVVEIVGISSAVAFTGLRKTVANFGVKRARGALKKTGKDIAWQTDIYNEAKEEADFLAPQPKKKGKGTKTQSPEEEEEWLDAKSIAEQEKQELEKLQAKKPDQLARLQKRTNYRKNVANRQDFQSRVYDGAARHISSVARQVLKKSRNS